MGRRGEGVSAPARDARPLRCTKRDCQVHVSPGTFLENNLPFIIAGKPVFLDVISRSVSTEAQNTNNELRR
jgi:hypothetical protein